MNVNVSPTFLNCKVVWNPYYVLHQVLSFWPHQGSMQASWRFQESGAGQGATGRMSQCCNLIDADFFATWIFRQSASFLCVFHTFHHCYPYIHLEDTKDTRRGGCCSALHWCVFWRRLPSDGLHYFSYAFHYSSGWDAGRRVAMAYLWLKNYISILPIPNFYVTYSLCTSYATKRSK